MARKKREEEPKPPAPTWMATYTDMVTLLMCFFILMYALSSDVDEARLAEIAQQFAARNLFSGGALGSIFSDSSGFMPDGSPPLPITMDPEAPQAEEIVDEFAARRARMEGMAETFRTYMAPYESAQQQIGVTVDSLGEYMLLTFPSAMLFSSGQATLMPEAIEMIDYVASYLQDLPGHRIAIQGHTDSVPINTLQFPSNFHLSASRAIAVLQRLVYHHGFNPALLSAEGMGEFSPIATNDTEEGRAENRRVEIKVFAQQQELTLVLD